MVVLHVVLSALRTSTVEFFCLSRGGSKGLGGLPVEGGLGFASLVPSELLVSRYTPSKLVLGTFGRVCTRGFTGGGRVFAAWFADKPYNGLS